MDRDQNGNEFKEEERNGFAHRQFPGARCRVMQQYAGRAEQSQAVQITFVCVPCVYCVRAEACAATSIGTMGDRNLGQTGPPLSCCEVRLEDIPDMKYLSTDKHPRGEICVRGPNVFAGYWRDPENTAATVVDGWLHTGDVGRFNPNGTISIIDRKKNLFKLSQGEYIAVESVESAYAKAGTVGQVWVYGNGFKSFLLGVVVPAAEPTAAFAFSKGWWPRAEAESTKLVAETFPADFKALWEGPHRDELKAWVMEALRAQDKQLKGFERVTDFIIEANVDKLGMAFTEANE